MSALDSLDQLAAQVFEGYLVRKDLAQTFRGQYPVPTYVGEFLLANVRRDSLVARVGGDEFGILLPRASPHYTAAIATRLCELLASRPLFVRGFPEASERITLSIGVAGWQAGESSAEWYARADAALYEAKRRGRNRVSIARMLEPEF